MAFESNTARSAVGYIALATRGARSSIDVLNCLCLDVAIGYNGGRQMLMRVIATIEAPRDDGRENELTLCVPTAPLAEAFSQPHRASYSQTQHQRQKSHDHDPFAVLSQLERKIHSPDAEKRLNMDITRYIITHRDSALLVGDYKTYHQQLSRQLASCQKKLGRATPKNAKFSQKAPVTAEDIGGNHEQASQSSDRE